MPYASTVLATAGLVTLWELGEKTGAAIDLKDSNNGTYWSLGAEAGMTYSDGIYRETPARGQTSLLPNGEGKSVALSADYLDPEVPAANNPPHLRLGDTWTVEAWVKPTSLAGNSGIVSKGEGAYYMRLEGSGVTLLKSQVAAILWTGQGKLEVDKTYYIVGVKSGETAKIYIDGVEAASTTTSKVVCEDGAELYTVGADRPLWDKANAVFQYAAAYRFALDKATVEAHYAAGSVAGYAAAILATPGIVMLWELGETEGKAINLLEGRARPSLLPSEEGKAAVFNAHYSDRVETATVPANLNLGDEFSLEAWVMPFYPLTLGAFISKGNKAYALRMAASGAIELIKSNVAVILATATKLELDKAYHVVATKKGKAARIYIDGVEAASTEASGVVCEDNGFHYGVGFDKLTDATRFDFANATIQYAAAYNVALDKATVEAHYKAGESLITVKVMLGGEVKDKPRYVLVGGELINA